MTIQDFAESVVAGWLPLTFRPAVHVINVGWHFVCHYLVSRWTRGKVI